MVSYANYMKGTMSSERMWQVADQLHSAAIHLLRRLRIQDLACGIGPAKLSALSVLVFSGRPLTLAELASTEQVKKPTMSRLVAAMKRDRLVQTASSKTDSRSIQITPTPRGRAVLMAGKKRRVDLLAKGLGTLDDPQVRRLAESIDDLQSLIRRI